MDTKLFDSEFKLMELLWEVGSASAKELSLMAARQIGWNKNTTYTVIKKLVDKGCIQRTEPGFVCTALISRSQVCRSEVQSLADRLYGGSKKLLFSALLEEDTLSREELDQLRQMIDER